MSLEKPQIKRYSSADYMGKQEKPKPSREQQIFSAQRAILIERVDSILEKSSGKIVGFDTDKTSWEKPVDIKTQSIDPDANYKEIDKLYDEKLKSNDNTFGQHADDWHEAVEDSYGQEKIFGNSLVRDNKSNSDVTESNIVDGVQTEITRYKVGDKDTGLACVMHRKLDEEYNLADEYDPKYAQMVYSFDGAQISYEQFNILQNIVNERLYKVYGRKDDNTDVARYFDGLEQTRELKEEMTNDDEKLVR